MKIDNFALTMFQTCPAKYRLRIVDGWTSRGRSGALGFGSALHYGLAEWYRTGGNISKALLAINDGWPADMPIDDWRTKEKCVTTMIDYAKRYPQETFKVVGAPDSPVVEVAFTLDTGLYLPCPCTPETTEMASETCTICGHPREPIEYGGIYDMLIEFSDHLYVVDHKTTSIMGNGYFNQFKPNNQMSGYIWAASKMSSKRVAGAFINGIGVYKSSATKFEREITSRSQAGLDEWLINLWHSCCAIDTCNRKGYWPLHTNACTLYGLCEFHAVHSLEHESERVKRLNTDYINDRWDYENRD